MGITQVKDRPAETLKKMRVIYREAAEKGMNPSHYLERHVDPSRDWNGGEARLGAFGRLMSASRVIWKSKPSDGVWADRFGEIYQDDDARALLPEFFATVWRRTVHEGWSPQVGYGPMDRFVLNSGEEILGTAMRPYIDAAGAYYQDLTPGISLTDLVALNTPIDGDSYRKIYLDQPDVEHVRMNRIAETAELPRAIVRQSQHTINLFKYGKAFEISYEALRRVPIDKVGFFIAQLALQTEKDRVAQAFDVLLNGDGNAGTSAENFTQASLDTGTTLTLRGWLAWKAKWLPPYQLTHVFMRESESVDLQLLNLGTQNPLLVNVGQGLGYGTINPLQPITNSAVFYGLTNDVAADVMLGIDRRFALERVTEIGSDIQETENFIERQTRILTFSEVDGFAIMDDNAAKTWSAA